MPESTTDTIPQLESPLRYPSFVDPSADVILRTTDGIKFPVMKGILTLASSAMKALLSNTEAGALANRCSNMSVHVCIYSPLTQINAFIYRTTVDGVVYQTFPIVEVDERCRTLDTILRIIYPLPVPDTFYLAFDDDDLASDVFDAADKLGMPRVIQFGFASLLDIARGDIKNWDASAALKAFAVACRYKLTKEAAEAARLCLMAPIRGIYVKEFEHITGGELNRLYTYQRDAGAVIKKAIALANKSLRKQCREIFEYECCSMACEGTIMNFYSPNSYKTQWEAWWTAYGNRASAVIQDSPLSQDLYSADVWNEGDHKTVLVICPECNKQSNMHFSTFKETFKAYLDTKLNNVRRSVFCLCFHAFRADNNNPIVHPRFVLI